VAAVDDSTLLYLSAVTAPLLSVTRCIHGDIVSSGVVVIIYILSKLDHKIGTYKSLYIISK